MLHWILGWPSSPAHTHFLSKDWTPSSRSSSCDNRGSDTTGSSRPQPGHLESPTTRETTSGRPRRRDLAGMQAKVEAWAVEEEAVIRGRQSGVLQLGPVGGRTTMMRRSV
nr:uncharacterized protein LOC113828779 [Penaeus vannamei]